MLQSSRMPTQSTSWGQVANWYDELLETGSDTLQEKVILPNLLRLMEIKKGQKILDLACGQGFFARAFARAGAEVVGVDISPELIAAAQKRTSAEQVSGATYFVASAEQVSAVKSASMDIVTVILSLQNIANVQATVRECMRVLKSDGRLFIVMNHPAFRVSKESGWGWDEEKKVQYRRIDQYLSEAKIKIDMHPGEKQRVYTTTFHRPLQFYFKSLNKAGLAVTRLEEWISHRQGPKGRKFAASERARKEIPLFLFLDVRKNV